MTATAAASPRSTERFDPDDNSKRCFDEALAAMREQRDEGEAAA